MLSCDGAEATGSACGGALSVEVASGGGTVIVALADTRGMRVNILEFDGAPLSHTSVTSVTNVTVVSQRSSMAQAAQQPPPLGVPEQAGEDLQASQRFASAPCRRAISEAYELWHRSTTRRARLQKAQEVFRANVSGRLVWYVRNQSESEPLYTTAHAMGIAHLPRLKPILAAPLSVARVNGVCVERAEVASQAVISHLRAGAGGFAAGGFQSYLLPYGLRGFPKRERGDFTFSVIREPLAAARAASSRSRAVDQPRPPAGSVIGVRAEMMPAATTAAGRIARSRVPTAQGVRSAWRSATSHSCVMSSAARTSAHPAACALTKVGPPLRCHFGTLWLIICLDLRGLLVGRQSFPNEWIGAPRGVSHVSSNIYFTRLSSSLSTTQVPRPSTPTRRRSSSQWPPGWTHSFAWIA